MLGGPASAARLALLAAIVDSSDDAIISKTLDGRITSWNVAAETMYGYPAEEAIGRLVTMIIPADRVGEMEAILARIRAGHRLEHYETMRLRRDGRLIPVSLTVSPVNGPDGAPIGASSIARDITERTKTQTRFEGLLEAAPDAMVGVNNDGTIAFVNHRAEALFGYDRAELLGRSVDILVPDAARAVHPSHRARYFRDPRPRPMGAMMQLAARRRDGSEFPAEISLSALETDEGLLVSAAVRNVSERLEAQAERERLRAEAERQRYEIRLQQSQRLESLGQLAGGVAHDFNNLLGVILIYLALVAEEVARACDTDPDHWAPVGSDVERIRQAAERAAALTRQLLAFGRREVVHPQVINLNAVAANIEELLRRTIGEHVELVADLGAGLWPVLADAGQIEQVLVNLALNARDAMPGGGTLTLDTENVVVDDGSVPSMPGARPGPYVRLRITDTGSGMEADVLEHAIEPFFTTKPKGEGTGLGLATVYGIVTQADGFLQMTSAPGVGTRVSAYLPATGEQLTAPPVAPAEPATAIGGRTILVVEDEVAIREVTARILTRNGFTVLAAASGAEAIHTVDRHPDAIDLLITDVVMPQMTGKDVAEALTARIPGLPVLYMSGYAHPELASRGTLDAGVTLIEKPFTEPQLLAKIRHVLEAAPERGPAAP